MENTGYPISEVCQRRCIRTIMQRCDTRIGDDAKDGKTHICPSCRDAIRELEMMLRMGKHIYAHIKTPKAGKLIRNTGICGAESNVRN
jgi:hypothetical protein